MRSFVSHAARDSGVAYGKREEDGKGGERTCSNVEVAVGNFEMGNTLTLIYCSNFIILSRRVTARR